MLTTFLSRADVMRHVHALHLLEAFRGALAGAVPGSPPAPVRVEVPGQGCATVVSQATLPGLPVHSVLVGSEAGGRTRSTVQLYDSTSGALLAVMDASALVALRGSLVAAVAADALAAPGARTVALLGVGPPVSSALKALRLVRSVDHVRLFASDGAASFAQALELQTALKASVRAAPTAGEALAGADIVVITSQPEGAVDAVQPGAHVSILGPVRDGDAPWISPGLAARARRFSDGPAAEGSTPLAEVLAGRVRARSSPDEVTLFVSGAPGHLDLLAAWHVYEGARADAGLTRLDLETSAH